ncbi:hypothetical protein, conserved [Plasmodium gonderi]|uniref:PIPK domain-containing protein n=1 Tax=Plasmodium gonderi TaxID=77519 RepID=A0A1Y1JQI6_PLAGO|nr:hypothetical protein, conserved [Plasmodium gonderi]GAW83092.1 hypothetical protein, conserved [Plasmodium gonderi]
MNMESRLSDSYFSFQNDSKHRKTSQRFFEWILNYPLFSEIRNSSLSNRFNIQCINDGEILDTKQIQEKKKKNKIRKGSYIPISKRDGLTTNIIKNEIRKEDYSLIINNKFYTNIIKKSEHIYKTYNDSLIDEKQKKLIFEKIKEKYFKKKKEQIQEYIPPLLPPSFVVNNNKKKILGEKFNPFFNFFKKDIIKNIYHDSINFSLKTNIQLNRYFYKVISNQLQYYRIKNDLCIHVINILNEISKYYHSYGYDILSNVKVKYFPYKNIVNSFYINGLVFSNCSIYFDDVEIKNPKVLLLDAEKKNEYEMLENCYNYNYNYTYFVLKNLSNRHLNIILIHGEIDFYLKKLLMNKKIYYFTSIKKKNLCRLSNMLRIKILNYDDFINFDRNIYIAKANYFKIQKYKKNVKNIFLCCNSKFLTICIFGKKGIQDGMEKQSSITPADLDYRSRNETTKKGNKPQHNGMFYTLLKRETEKENMLEKFLQVYYKNKNDDYIVDYFFINKEKKINLVRKEKYENKRKALINHIKNVIIIKKVKKLIKFCIFLTFHIYRQLYFNNYMFRTLLHIPDRNISTNVTCDNFYKKFSNSVLFSSIFLFYNHTQKKIKNTPINFMSNLFHLINIHDPLTRERLKIMHMLIKTNKIIKEQVYNNYEHCFFNVQSNKIIDIVNYFIFKNFMKNLECNYNCMYYYLKIINSAYLHYNKNNVITNDETFLKDSNILCDPISFNDEIVIEKKLNEKAEQIIAQNILFYCYQLESAKNIEMIIYFICPSYMFIHNLYSSINIYLFDNQNHSAKKLFYNFFFNYKYIFDISLQQFVCVIHALAFNLICPFESCGNYLCYHQICIQIFLKRVVILFKKEKKDNEKNEIIMNIMCNKCDVVQEKVLNTNFSFCEFLLTIIHSENYMNMQCNHNGKNNTYELSYRNIKICFFMNDNDIYQSIRDNRTYSERQIKSKYGRCRINRSNVCSRACYCSNQDECKKCYSVIKNERKIKNYIKKNVKNIIYNSVFYYYPCKCITRKYKCKYRNGTKERKENIYTNFNLYNIIENFPFFTSSMLPMYSSLKYLIYNFIIQYYRSKNKHLYEISPKKRKKENFNNPTSPLYFTNKCKKCKYIKISNFSTLGFFNVLFIIKRIFFNFYITINFIITLLGKNMFIKVNEIEYCVNNTAFFIEDNFLLIKGCLENEKENLKENIQERWKINVNKNENNEKFNKCNNVLLNSAANEFKCEEGEEEVEEEEGETNSVTQNVYVLHNQEKRTNDSCEEGIHGSNGINETNVKTVYSNGEEKGNYDDNVYVTKQTCSKHEYILKDINKVKENLIKQFLLFRKFKKKLRFYKMYLIKVFRNFYYYAIAHLMEKHFSLDIEIFFSFYIMILEKTKLKIQRDIETMTKLTSNRKLQYLRYIVPNSWDNLQGRMKRIPNKFLSFFFANIRYNYSDNYSTNKHNCDGMQSVKWRSKNIRYKRVQMKKLMLLKKKYSHIIDMKKKQIKSNIKNLKSLSKNKSELSNHHHLVREYDVHKLFLKESYYIYNIENYRKRKYLDDMNKEEYEHSNKKLFYLHISNIVDSVIASGGIAGHKTKPDKIGQMKKPRKTSSVFLLNPNDTSNSIFHALISDEYKTRLVKIYKKEKGAHEEGTYKRGRASQFEEEQKEANRNVQDEANQNVEVEAKADEYKDEVVLLQKEERLNDSKKIIIKKELRCGNKKRTQRNKHLKDIHHEEIKKYIKKNIRIMTNRLLTNRMINKFINSKNNEVLVISINDNTSVYIYFPLQFYYLRKFLCKKETTFLRSLIKSNYINFDHKKRHFVKTYDDKYILKEINKYEFKSFVTRYKEFFQHFSDICFQRKKSLLCFMYGLFQIEIKKKNRKTFKTYIILENVKIERTNSKILIFDIKGARKKKNLQKLMKQNKKSFSFFELNDTLSHNSYKMTEEKDMTDDNSSGISVNLRQFSKYLRMEKKNINFKCTNYNNLKQEIMNVFYSKKGYLQYLSAEKEHSKGREIEREENYEQDDAERVKKKKEKDVSKIAPNVEGEKSFIEKQEEQDERMCTEINSGDKKGLGSKKHKTTDGYNSQNNAETMKKIYRNTKQKMLCGFFICRNVEPARNSLMRIRRKKRKEKKRNSLKIAKKSTKLEYPRNVSKGKSRRNKKEKQKNWRIFLNDIIYNTKEHLFLNTKLGKLRKKKIIHKRNAKRLRTKYLYSTKVSLHFLARKKEYILNKDNLIKHKVRGEGTTDSVKDGTYNLLNNEPLENKNLESLNSQEKYNNFVINNYNSLKSYTILFDDNFKDFIKSNVINLEYNDYKYLMDSLKEDTEFLSGQDIMDYSLLIHIDIANFVIIFKIIDYLRPYTWDKSVENFSKSVLYLTKGYRPTIIHSEYYKKRFLSNIKKYIFYYLPIYALQKKIVFKIAKRKDTFSILNLNKNHPFKIYFYYQLFNLTLRYYNNYYIYVKYFSDKQTCLYNNSLLRNIYSKQILFIFLSYYQKEYYIQCIEENKKKKKNAQTCYDLYLKNLTTIDHHFSNWEELSNSFMGEITLRDGALSREIISKYFDSNKINSNSTSQNLNRKLTTNKLSEGNAYLHNLVSPYCTLDQCVVPRNICKAMCSNSCSCMKTCIHRDMGREGTFDKHDECISSILNGNNFPCTSSEGIPLQTKQKCNIIMNMPNLFSINRNSFDEREFKKLKKQFYKKISRFQIKILKKLQKYNFKIEGISDHVQNNVYIQMRDTNIHYTNINYLDAYNIYNICEKDFNKMYKRSKYGKKKNTLLYIPSYFLFALNKY